MALTEDEVRRLLVRGYLNEHLSIRALARRYNMPPSTVRNWLLEGGVQLRRPARIASVSLRQVLS